MEYDIRKLTDYLWEVPKTGGVRVPARIYATEEMIAQIESSQQFCASGGCRSCRHD